MCVTSPGIITQNDSVPIKSFFFLVTLQGLWDLISLIRDSMHALKSESVESEPLDHQGIPLNQTLRKQIFITFLWGSHSCFFFFLFFFSFSP